MQKRSPFSRRTKIICTIGPATGSAFLIERLARAGMDIARLNLSHGSYEEHTGYVRAIRRMKERLQKQVAILMDLPGPKYRTGKMKAGSAVLKKGAEVVLTTRQIDGDENEVPVNLPTLPRDVRVGDTVLLDDGAMQLRAMVIKDTDVVCKVVIGGLLTEGRGVVVPGMRVTAPFVTDQLKKHIDFALGEKPDYIALSFVSKPDDVEQVRAILRERNQDVPIVSKIERGVAVRHFDRILAVSDGIMVARGDLGVDIPLEKIPLIQKEIIRKCNQAGKPVITATQMLESMVNAARPTRAEVTDIANAILDGTDAIMLSAETSIGKYPVPAVRMMAQIARETERELPYELMLTERGRWLEHETDELISYNACYTAHWLGAAAIIAFTQSGSTARRVSKYRPKMPIIAITPDEGILGRLTLHWGVRSFYVPNPASVEGLFAAGAGLAKDLGLAKAGDVVVITGGIPLGVAGSTNLLKVEQIV